jgi:uncharacterized protein
MKVVSNTTPIISLACIDKIDILKLLFSKIHIPRLVYKEIKTKPTFGFNEIESDYFEIIEIKDRDFFNILLKDLDEGEAESIVLAKEINADILIKDEKTGYNIARKNGIFSLRTLSILYLAKQKGLIPQVKPLLDIMIDKGRWYSQRVRNNFLKSIGEL